MYVCMWVNQKGKYTRIKHVDAQSATHRQIPHDYFEYGRSSARALEIMHGYSSQIMKIIFRLS